MKRFYFSIAALLLACMLCGCQENIYDITHNGKVYTVDRELRTVTCDDVVYQFQIIRSGENSVELEITYPDGSRYYWTQHDHTCLGGCSIDYNPEGKGYEPGETLRDVLGPRPASWTSGSGLLAAFFLLAAGALLAITPHTAWMMMYGWRFKDAEPSDMALLTNRVIGVTIIIIVMFFLVASFL